MIRLAFIDCSLPVYWIHGILLEDFFALYSNLTAFELQLQSVNLPMAVGVDTSIHLEDCAHRDLLSSPTYPRSTADPVDLDRMPSILLPGCYLTPASVSAESVCGQFLRLEDESSISSLHHVFLLVCVRSLGTFAVGMCANVLTVTDIPSLCCT